MTELKTLKDISWRGIEGETKDWVVTHEALKQEAIKWVKFYRNSEKKVTMLSESIASKIFMNFFNITEEELK